MDKIFITQQELAEQLQISEKTLNELIRKGDLPDYSYGNKDSRKKGWHVSALEKHALDRYEVSQKIRNAQAIPMNPTNLTIMPTQRHNFFPEQQTNGENTSNMKSGKKKRTKCMTPFIGTCLKNLRNNTCTAGKVIPQASCN